MRRLCAFVLCVTLVACIMPTEGRNARCWYPGDTVAMLGPYRTPALTWTCTWIVADHITCFDLAEGNPGRMTLSDCILPNETD